MSRPEPEEEGVYVGSGTFKIDHEAMVERIGKFAYARPQQAFVSLVRVAVMSGADDVSFRGVEGGVEVEIGGKPFAREALANPYDCFQGEAPDRARRMALARALLTLLHGGAESIAFESGTTTARWKNWKDKPALETLGEPRPSQLTILWKGSASSTLAGLPEHLAAECAECSIAVRAQGLPGQKAPMLVFEERNRRDVSVEIREPGARGRVDPAAGGVGGVSLYYAGARVESVELRGRGLPAVEGFVERDDFALDVSETGVVRDAAYERAMTQLREAAQKLGAQFK